MKKAIIIAVALIATTCLANVGYDRSMEAYCTKLQTQAEQYKPEFFISQLDHDECSNVYHIEIDAPIKVNE